MLPQVASNIVRGNVKLHNKIQYCNEIFKIQI